MTTIVFPFDLYGSAGTGAGALLLADAVREMIEDAELETRPTRTHALRDRITIDEFAFDSPAEVGNWRQSGRSALFAPFQSKEPILWLAGNHLGVLPVYEELGEKGLVIQFDAHFDVFALADSPRTPSHGNFLLHADGPIPPIVHVGNRDLFLPMGSVKKHFRAIVSGEDCALDPDGAAQRIKALAAKASRIWIDIDCDAFDPAFVPAVQNALPMGLAPSFVLRILAGLKWEKVAGLSISEFDPGRDDADRSLLTLAWLIEWSLLKWLE